MLLELKEINHTWCKGSSQGTIADSCAIFESEHFKFVAWIKKINATVAKKVSVENFYSFKFLSKKTSRMVWNIVTLSVKSDLNIPCDNIVCHVRNFCQMESINYRHFQHFSATVEINLLTMKMHHVFFYFAPSKICKTFSKCYLLCHFVYIY